MSDMNLDVTNISAPSWRSGVVRLGAFIAGFAALALAFDAVA